TYTIFGSQGTAPSAMGGARPTRKLLSQYDGIGRVRIKSKLGYCGTENRNGRNVSCHGDVHRSAVVRHKHAAKAQGGRQFPQADPPDQVGRRATTQTTNPRYDCSVLWPAKKKHLAIIMLLE